MSATRPIEHSIPAFAVSATLPATNSTDALQTPGSAHVRTHGAGLVLFEATAVDGLTGTIEVLTAEGGTWRTWESFQMAAGSAPARVAPTSTITLVAGDFIFVECWGFYAVRFKRAAGTSATLTVRTGESAMAFILTRVLTDTTVVNVGSAADKISVTPTVDTSAYTANDVWFDSTAVAGATRVSAGTSILMDVTILDKDDQTAADVYLFFLSSNVSLGTINNAPSISDANAANILGWVKIASSDWYDVVGSKVAHKNNINIMLEAATGTTIYVAGVTTGTPTQTASGVIVTLGIIHN